MELTKSDILAVIGDRVAKRMWKLQLLTLAVGVGLSVLVMKMLPVDLEVVSFGEKIAWALVGCLPLVGLLVLMSRKMGKAWKLERALCESDAATKAILERK